MPQSNRSKKAIKQVFLYIILVPAGLLGGMLIGRLIAMQASSAVVGGDGLSSFAMFVIALVILLLHIVIHEAGHLVFGLLSGYRFLSFRVGSIMLVKDGGRLRLKTLSIAGTGGQCIMIPPAWREEGFPFVAYNLGGALMNLIAAAVGLLLWVLIAFHPVWSTILILFFAIGIVNGLLNAIPMRLALVDNDGSNVRMLKKNPHAEYAFYQMLHIHAQSAAGQRLRDMPQEWFTPPAALDLSNPICMSIEVFAISRMMDQQVFEQASERIITLFQSGAAIAGLHKSLLRCELAFCQMMRGDFAEAGVTLDEDLRKFMHSMRNYPSVLRTQYAQALMMEHDLTKADQLLAQFERIAKRYPYQSDIQSERALIEAASSKSA